MPITPGLAAEVARLDCDVLHVHSPNPMGELPAVMNDRARARVVTFHAELGKQRFLRPIYRPLQRRLFTWADTVIVGSPPMERSVDLIEHREKVSCIPYGVSPTVAALIEGHAAERPDPDRPDDLRLLFVGRLVYYKGVEVLLRSLALDPSSRVTATIVGDGPLRTDLEEMARFLGLDRRVSFLGLVPDDELPGLYASHDAFVLPSVSAAEAFGLSMAEAMVGGLPAISTELDTGTSWVNLDEVSGLVVAPDDPAALAAAVRRLNEPALRARLAAGARDRATTEMDFSRHVARVGDVYQSAMEHRP
jgi:glycosyltransferase involved in cell wall biosynthesis